MRINFHPGYTFARPITPAMDWFAWMPVRYWWGEWVWLRTVSRQKHSKIPALDGPDLAFWSYAHSSEQ
jgi:hypothetical protein